MNTFPGLVHTARHTTKVGNTRSRWPNRKEGAVEGGISDWGEVVRQLRPPLVTAGEKLGCMLGTPSIRWYFFSGSENPSGADNQQGSLRDPSETARRAPINDRVKIQSDPHGDMRRAAEMTAPPTATRR